MNIIKNLLFLAVFSGLLFGSWPIILKESGLQSYFGSAVYCLVVLGVVGTLSMIYGTGDLAEVKWHYAILGGLVGGIALAAFVYMLTTATRSEVGNLFLITLLCQMLLPALYTVIANWERDGFPSLKKTAGILGVFVVAYLLK